MSTTQDRVGIETPAGNVRAGTVVGRELEATAAGARYVYRVRVQEAVIRVDEDDVAFEAP